MDKSEPTLVPEWLKNTGSLAGGGSTSHLDDRATSMVVRNKPSANGHDFGRSSSDMTTSSYLRRSSNSNGSGYLRPYSSFGRNQRDKEWEKETYSSRDRGRVVSGNRRHRDYSDSPGGTFSSTFERDSYRNSQSIVSGKQNDTWHKNFNSASENKNNGLYIRNNPVREVKKEAFEKDFPSLGADDKAVHEVGRVPSPSISSAIHSLPVGSSVPIGGEKWTSALAEVPVLAVSNGTPSSSMAVVSDTHTSLNMAKTVAQGPSRAQTTPQSSVGTQRLEELEIKKSRQLIPVTPALLKPLVVNTSDKPKNKLGQHHLSISSSFPVTHSARNGPMNGDMSKTLNGGKLHLLKPVVREKNGVSPKETSSPTNGAPVLGSKGSPYKPSERKPVLTVLEKRPTPQALSRNDFFNQMRKKSMLNSSSVPDSAVSNSSPVPDSAVSNSSPGPDKVTEMEAVLAPSIPQAGCTQLSENASRDHSSNVIDGMSCNGVDSQGKKHSRADRIFSEEEEAAFLRSMGWEENADEDVLTEEEINEFYRDATKYINSKPSLKILEGVRSKFLSPISCVSSEVSPSGAKLES